MYTYATSPADVVVDKSTGKPPPPDKLTKLTVFTARGGQQITAGLRDLDGNPLPGYLTVDEDGRFSFTDDAERPNALWVRTPEGQWYSLVANEMYAGVAEVVAGFPVVQQAVDEAKNDAAAAKASAKAAELAVDDKVNVADLVPLSGIQEAGF